MANPHITHPWKGPSYGKREKERQRLQKERLLTPLIEDKIGLIDEDWDSFYVEDLPYIFTDYDRHNSKS